jgi:hypothetical protein
MSDKSVAEKLQIKPDCKVLFINAPKNFRSLLGEMPSDVTILIDAKEKADIIQLYVADKAELEEVLPEAKSLMDAKSILWVTYHKGTSKIKTDINRDTICAYAISIGLKPVAMIAVNDDWAALRLKLA